MTILVFGEWYAEQIPRLVPLFAVAQGGRHLALVDNEVAANLQVLGTHRHAVLVILLVLVQSVVLIDVFHVGSGFVRRVVAFLTRVGVG